MPFAQIKNPKELGPFIDFLIEAGNKMVKKTGDPTATSELLMRNISVNVANGSGFLLVHADDNTKKLDAFMFAVFLGGSAKFVEFIGMWTAPGVGKKFRFQANQLFEKWAREKGARKIVAGLTRGKKHGLKFFKFFHEPLGWKQTGIIIEKSLEGDK